ncbi:hypothetical protein TCAL_00718 [Tigriopus californicus]|uniref:Amino acid transporter transmembrane domain-containing protein n=2 Tax=Tigriopus californicus TaxID=6832 RepID=A0A553PAE9_TIGCA|nr:hypothetical protein TCAL_00718 [Tigriopus californicus]|eukprot:TCALIF_00718-PA protein Name:"Similar to SLC38A9 Putative sodium-coupled neutral amino acid transporter 9 (Homo sapiens)" AED:0.28 eAED:0.28 QI:62/1/1/1/1/1/5/756/386
MLGPAYEPIVGICSLGAVLGAAIVYWVLMSNFLYSSVVLAYDKITGAMHGHPEQYALICAISPDRNATEIANPSQGNSGYPIYPMPPFVGPLPAVFPDPEASSFFDTYWTHKSVAFYLSGGVLPLITWAKPGFLQKFNCIGTLNIFVLIGVVIYFASEWGINVEFHDIASPMYIPWGSGTVYCLSGTLSMGMFIHNAIITITSRQGARKENNVRDTKIAFALVLISYLLIGVLFYLSFPLPKNCIADNFLNNFHTNNPIMAVCRVFLLFQLVTVFPIIMLILRNQVLSLMPTVSQDNNTLITFINVSTCGFCVFIAIIYPNIGNIIRYSGAACGMIMMFVAPCLCHMMYMREESQVHPMAIILEVIIICAGVLNFVAQFLPLSWFG